MSALHYFTLRGVSSEPAAETASPKKGGKGKGKQQQKGGKQQKKQKPKQQQKKGGSKGKGAAPAIDREPLVRTFTDGTTEPREVSAHPFSKRTMIRDVLAADTAWVSTEEERKIVTVGGWARSVRKQKSGGLAFIALTDGSVIQTLQVVAREELDNFDDILSCSAGTSFLITGVIVESQGSGQSIELVADSVEISGPSDGAVYPLAGKKQTMEFLRDVAHLRPRTNTIGAVMRLRSALAYATHSFFQGNGFVYVHTPLITASDCEGAGEMFRVSTLDGGNPPRLEDGSVNIREEFFKRDTFLTVSGQLNVETYCCALSNVYTFGPTFRAENSNTTRHLAEFWMIEPELAYADIYNNMDCAEAYLKACIQHVLDNCIEDIRFLDDNVESGLEAKLLALVTDEPYLRISYTEAVRLCLARKKTKSGKSRFEKVPEWGKELQTEHERYLAEEVYNAPVIIYNYPAECKAFYMRTNPVEGEPGYSEECGHMGPDGQRTVAAMDVILPRVGELMGGSQREERLDVLLNRIEELELDLEAYQWYLDLRRFGTVEHSGFGLGFERLVMICSGMENIRDVIPFPRTPGVVTF